MKRHEFKITINANPGKVWNILIGEQTYPEWTSVFCEGSRVETDWLKGSKVLFLDGNGSGMVSWIEEKIPNEYISFKHVGEVKNGVEDTESESVRKWAGAMEIYTLKQTAPNQTEWLVECDVVEEFEAYMLEKWPQALIKVKELAEGVKEVA